jgi:hypothetical protein
VCVAVRRFFKAAQFHKGVTLVAPRGNQIMRNLQQMVIDGYGVFIVSLQMQAMPKTKMRISEVGHNDESFSKLKGSIPYPAGLQQADTQFMDAVGYLRVSIA